ncbi:UPF0146 family protein [Natronosalvus vescus]|uniref:UPF0146 family protein n=1 Tax=Natronosalvus vescus TaxID=2953881 RepID=UPI00209020EE|nr:UPF0146 family protein [Natronosalvus vescus]
MARFRRNQAALIEKLAAYDALVEIGIGRRTGVASALLEGGCSVVATDIQHREVPDDLPFVLDDVTDPTLARYADADALYALNLPPELHRPTLEVARAVDADFLFTTLGGDPPLVQVERVALPRETLFVARRATG